MRPRVHAVPTILMQGNNKHFPSTSILLLLVAMLLLPGCKGKAVQPEAVASDSTATSKPDMGRVVMEVARTSRLYTTEYQVHKIVTHSDDPTLEGQVLGVPFKMKTRWGDRKVAIPITVTLKAYVDFSQFSADQVKRTPDGHLEIILPDPKVVQTSSRVDHNGTRQYIDATRSRYTDAEISDFARQGADSIVSHSMQLDIVDQAERSAAQTLFPLLRRMGYKDGQVTISFRKEVKQPGGVQIIRPS